MYKFMHKQLPVQFYNYFDSVLEINKRTTRASQKKVNFVSLDFGLTDYKDPSNTKGLK